MTDGIELVPSSLVPIESLYEVLYRGGGAGTWRTRGQTVTMEVFAGLILSEGVASFGVVRAAADGRIVGHVGLYNCDQVSGVASVAAYFDQRVPVHELIAAVAIRDFLDYVFDVVGLRKIHVEMPAASLGSLSQIVERLGVATVEGTFRAHTKIGRKYHDMQQLALILHGSDLGWSGRVVSVA